ncbi:helix-turn-helix transcriptional regulator [Zhihengliuella halotolerans]|nr:helix-turn-helix transcriptional regulator [Zhihengliuella halotolerans]
MERKGWSNRRLAKYAECAPGTIDNLLCGRTQSLNKGRTAELICEALDVPLDVYFVPEISSNTSENVKRAG